MERIHDEDSLLIHSDQGWHYRMNPYQQALRERGITPSMSRKGNCKDNSVREIFFGTLKSKFLYTQQFESIEHFKYERNPYISYYNPKRMKAKLKGMNPVQYRIHTLQAA